MFFFFVLACFLDGSFVSMLYRSMWVMVLLIFCFVAIWLGQIIGTVVPPAFSLSTIRVMPRSATLSRDLEEIYSNLSRVPVRRDRDPTRALRRQRTVT